jgi:hypothetical protein
MKTVALLACLFGATIAMPAVEQTRQQQIDEINSTPGVLWKAAVNPRFAGEPVGASAVSSTAPHHQRHHRCARYLGWMAVC